jgi:hypothetical protein
LFEKLLGDDKMKDMSALLTELKGKTIDYAGYIDDVTGEKMLVLYFTDGSSLEVNADVLSSIMLYPA